MLAWTAIIGRARDDLRQRDEQLANRIVNALGKSLKGGKKKG